ncbi:MAG TPA: FAD-binding oxidoreductase [Acidimicrobiales bacterium]|nr:FAD-binding oxidoreductase [Acidimicrobiales bacterium]
MTTAPNRTRSWWGWGWTDAALSDVECRRYASLVPGAATDLLQAPAIADLKLRAPRIEAPAGLEATLTSDPADRASHTYGKAFRDVVRALHGDMGSAPDLVAYPRTENDIVAVLDWAGDADVAVIPYGAGSSVVGGTEYGGDDHSGVVSLDLSRLDRVLEIDPVSRAAHIQAGIYGPALEDALRPRGYTLRHFPQSFEFSTLGGWLATRSGGHYATNRTHLDDFVESVRVVTPTGVSESWRLPGSGAGPSPDRLFLGSEGTLGVITEAWMRIQDRPTFKASTSVSFSDVAEAFGAVRSILQAGCTPANCRLLDPGEAGLSGASSSGAWILVLGEESAHHPVDDALALLVDIVRSAGGRAAEPTNDRSSAARGDDHESGDGWDGAADTWRSAFIRMPYVRDAMARMSVISETFETAVTWDHLETLYHDVRNEIGAAITEVTGAPGLINCRLTHSYPDGAAPYFTVIAAGRRGSEVAMWDEIKAAAMEVLTRHRATVTHHHAVGRDHRPGYDRQRPDRFAAALRAVKAELDPAGILNPGVLVDPG